MAKIIDSAIFLTEFLCMVSVGCNTFESVEDGEFQGENIDVFGGLTDKLEFDISALLD